MAPLPAPDVEAITAWCADRLPPSVRDQVRTECDVGDDAVVVVESRRVPAAAGPPQWSRCVVARLEYAGRWTLWWRDRQGTFQHYDFLPASERVDDLLRELDRDPVSVFWR